MHPIKTGYFLDFDHTLFNTDEFFHRDVRDSFLRFGIDAKCWEESYLAVWPTGYALEKHVEEICRRSGEKLPLNEMKQIVRDSFSDLSRYLFPDVVPFLEAAKEAEAWLGLLSFGDEGWQRYKVTSSGIDTYFDQMFFTAGEGRKAEVVLEHAREFRRIVVVDNSSDELDRIKDAVPDARTIYMNRVPDELTLPDSEVSRLKFLEARRYAGKVSRYWHDVSKTLHGILSV
ncbi:MAG: hypothetical protein A3H69_00055 [Candidatus Sungbacteria bacterium RIFCSPLOWO2_02_FULL_47_9]|uniref:Haloacid dehalogenase n=1 Tax=Candidatus Sungbacteria bacterium RIFCSPHIGHO2_01_FULL_47_32 TaxID=1802264 RepID=A0A1G2K4R6_9BACT|nr:MAG: hypothetical protein UX72_C0001G0112 [Parcubacteria group bacterium GW2011_GWA2_47_10]OGZ94429.1 MAG: hypothetical protein A2633_04095 [Candidatus Sungbacteria bacterium RIFCSPHIGHO2_01_FULL_47_32]OGZ98021.1 MAG: hypothetical protein A3D57_02800 [Candidatus Sungbacteria bacterium RIFCSPHIGHO2_02_FULL_46_12]OHA05771.1 MAG: hypothetical protein A3A28_05560 [Candidatus Sungbacteria bacterium RIFCSPLOWO2_01_FULL_47_32]OHA12166.1 MAG: hypothetical protein A3H69_00055 [Candidatus Sungbacteria